MAGKEVHRQVNIPNASRPSAFKPVEKKHNPPFAPRPVFQVHTFAVPSPLAFKKYADKSKSITSYSDEGKDEFTLDLSDDDTEENDNMDDYHNEFEQIQTSPYIRLPSVAENNSAMKIPVYAGVVTKKLDCSRQKSEEPIF